ncbi:MAG: Phosphoglucosamine mutase [Candidatus Izimaplasma bacterium HR2]|nr:MAG: Phosphoglucosamine mutase [Candidatus Izimaplasma bacterium HR2]
MAKYFGTDGIRGRYNLELTNSLAFKVGQSLKSVLNTNRLVIGMDTRESSSELLYSVISGAQSVGIDVMNAGVVSTPLISHYSKQKEVSGVMITASHNPYTDNGIKVFNKGNKLSESEELAIEDFIDNNPKFTVTTIGKLYSGEEVLDLYLDLIESLDFNQSSLRVGFDSANGANYLISYGILREMCKEHYQIGFKPDGKNINEGVGSTHLEAITKLVKDNNLDIGLSFDGDGDRVLVVDKDLDIIDGDLIIYIIANYLKDHGLLKKDTVVLTSMSNLGIIKAFERKGIKVVLTGVGDKYVLEELNKNGYSIGGENSGHVILRDYISTGDGLLVGAYLLNILEVTGKTLKELTSDIKMWPQTMENIRTFNKDILNDQRVVDVIEEVKGILGINGKVLIRASGTEPLIRVTISCELKSDVDKYVNLIVGVINEVKEEV